MSKRRELLAGMFSPQTTDEEIAKARSAPTLPSALGAMRSSLQGLTMEAERAKLLEAQIETGDRVVEIEPTLVDASFVRDRILVADDPGFEGFVASMKEGQQVPILVRAHPDRKGRFQAAYGHRRLAAAERLGRKVKAIVRQLSDAELVIAQGKENSDRRDLSFIERAAFASLLDERGFERQTIMASLSVDKGDLSRLLSIAKAVPYEIILAIGPAPKVGRARWTQLAEILVQVGAKKDVGKLIAGEAFKSADSNARVDILVKGLSSSKRVGSPETISVVGGKVIARVERNARSVRLSTDDLAFGNFLVTEMTRLHAEFMADLGESKSHKGGAG